MHLGNFSIETFKDQSEFPYIPSRLSTNVLNSLCQDPFSRAEISKSVVLSLKSKSPLGFLTDFHLDWAMECIGYAFSLQMDHSQIISQAIQIYNSWLNEPSKRPEIMSEKEAHYQREILGHMSLIFIERPWDPAQVDLCSQVLRIYRLLIREKKLLKENQHYLMSLFILSFSPILCRDSQFSKKIGGEMSRAVFEIWLRCETREEPLWKSICTDFARWIINTEVIHSWRSVAIGLTSKLVNFLYGENNDELLVIFQEEGTLSFSCSLEHTILAWNYLVNMILDCTVTSLFDPLTQKDIVKSVTNIIDVFLDVAHKRSGPRRPVTPAIVATASEALVLLSLKCQKLHLDYAEGNCCLPMPRITALVELFGNWMLVQVHMKGNRALGQAEAIGCLCKIFCKASGPAPLRYIERFYKALFKGFKSASESNIKVSGSIFINSVKLLTQDHYGVRLLLHKACVFKVFGPFITSKEIPALIKETCYSILSAVISIIKSYKSLDILPIINEAMIVSAGIESEPNNIISLFWSICAYIAVVDDQSLNDKLVKGLANKLLAMDYSNKKLYSECLSVLSVIPFMIQSQDLISDVIVKDIVSKYIATVSRKSTKNLSDSMYISVISMLMHWIIKFPKILKDNALRFQIFESLSNLKNFERMKEFVSYIELFLLNNIGNHFAEHRYSYCNSITITKSFLTENYAKDLKHFLLKHKILVSFYNTDDGVVAVIRNQIGRYVWKLRSVFGKSVKNTESCLNLNLAKNEKNIKIIDDKEKELELMKSLDLEEAKEFRGLCKKFFSSEDTLKAFTKPNVQKKVRVAETGVNTESTYRVFLAELGYFQQDLIGDISALKSREVSGLIQELDSINDKEVFIIPIFYLESPECTEEDLCEKLGSYPEIYLDFISQMGIFLSSVNRQQDMFRSTFNLLDKYGGLVLTRDYYFEIISLIPAVFCMEKVVAMEELLQYSQLAVMWNQRNKDPWSLKQPLVIDNLKLKRKTVILLTPMRNNIVKVNLIGNETNCGPLVNNMLVPKYHLGMLLSKSVANFYNSSTSRLALRQRRIEIFNTLQSIAKKGEITRNGKISAVVTHAYLSSS